LVLPDELPSVEEEKQLRKLVVAGGSFDAISRELQKSPEAVRAKIKRLGLEVDKQQATGSRSSTSNSIVPEELISAEEALKMLVGALKMACTPGLSKTEVTRLEAPSKPRSCGTENLSFHNLFKDYPASPAFLACFIFSIIACASFASFTSGYN
jgi:biotin operon repressor